MATATRSPYQITETRYGEVHVTGPQNRGYEGDGYYLGVLRSRFHAELFIRALELADLGAPIVDGLHADDEDDD